MRIRLKLEGSSPSSVPVHPDKWDEGSSKALGPLLRSLIPAVLLVVALSVLLVGVYVVPTGSMVPTIMPGDFILGEKASVRAGAPAIGDVVTFESPEEACTTWTMEWLFFFEVWMATGEWCGGGIH